MGCWVGYWNVPHGVDEERSGCFLSDHVFKADLGNNQTNSSCYCCSNDLVWHLGCTYTSDDVYVRFLYMVEVDCRPSHDHDLTLKWERPVGRGCLMSGTAFAGFADEAMQASGHDLQASYRWPIFSSWWRCVPESSKCLQACSLGCHNP